MSKKTAFVSTIPSWALKKTHKIFIPCVYIKKHHFPIFFAIQEIFTCCQLC